MVVNIPWVRVVILLLHISSSWSCGTLAKNCPGILEIKLVPKCKVSKSARLSRSPLGNAVKELSAIYSALNLRLFWKAVCGIDWSILCETSNQVSCSRLSRVPASKLEILF